MSDPFSLISAPRLSPATARRFLLECRYDYRQRVWNLPAAQLSLPEAALALARLQDYAGGLNALANTHPAPLADAPLSQFASPGRGDLLAPSRPPTKPRRVRPWRWRAGKFYTQPSV